MKRNPNLDLTKTVAGKLKPLLPEMVLVGGCAIGLLLNDAAGGPARATRDVDMVVDVVTYAQWDTVAAKLRKLGFSEDISGESPICRWLSGRNQLDVMPVDDRLLGFSNRWYREAMRSAIQITVDDGIAIRVAPLAVMLASKLEAFRSRGKSDFFLSTDFEDIVVLIDGRFDFVDAANTASAPVRSYLVQQFREICGEPEFEDSLFGHLMPDDASQRRVAVILERAHAITELDRRMR